MAEKRRLEAPEQKRVEEREDEEPSRKYRSIGWKEWLKMDFARYWFVVIALMVDLLFGLDAMNLIPGAGTLGFAVFLAITIPVEILIYIYLWGRNGKLMPPE